MSKYAKTVFSIAYVAKVLEKVKRKAKKIRKKNASDTQSKKCF